MADHDQSYKQFFSHPELVRDLLTGFVKEDWVERLDLATLEKTNGSYVSDDLREREDDMIWRVRYGEEWIYIYIIIEFQSTVDRFMAVRLMTYIGLLYQDLIRTGQLPKTGKLPPILPLVLYNGKQPWNSGTVLQDLIHHVPGGLEKYKPTLQYLLLDEGRHQLQGVVADNLVAAIFRLEQSDSPEDVQNLVRNLIQWLKEPEQASIRRSFAVWIRRVLLPVRLPGQTIPDINDLMEVDAMLAERVKEWTYEWKEEGMKEGMKEGIKEGMQKGEVEILLRQIQLKFGYIDMETMSMIQSAKTEQLLLWSERVLTAATLREMLQINENK